MEQLRVEQATAEETSSIPTLVDQGDVLYEQTDKINSPLALQKENSPSSNQPQELSGESSPNPDTQNFPSLDSFDEYLGSQLYTQQQFFSLNQLEPPSLSTSNGNMSGLDSDSDMSRLHQLNQQFQNVNENWDTIFSTSKAANDTKKIGTQIRY